MAEEEKPLFVVMLLATARDLAFIILGEDSNFVKSIKRQHAYPL